MYKYFSYVKSALTRFIPYACVACNQVSQNIVCNECQSKFYCFNDNKKLCNICSSILDKYTDYTCKYCSQTHFYFDATTTLFDNNLQLKPLIYAIKNGNIHTLKYLSKYLALRYAENLSANIVIKPDLLIYMPLHYKKLYSRGYNQSLLITKTLSFILNIPYKYEIVSTNSLHIQHLLNRRQRLQSVDNQAIFKLNLTYKDFIKNLNIAVIDDVITTGSTLNSFAKLLKNFGAKNVQNIVLARTQN